MLLLLAAAVLAVAGALPAAAAGGRTVVPFGYAWRFRYGPEPGSGVGPYGGKCHFQDIQDYECTNLERNPNRFDDSDCATSCCYNPDCLVWQHSTSGRQCFHGTKASTCTKSGKSSGLNGGQRKPSDVKPLKTDYAFSKDIPDVQDGNWNVVDCPHDFSIANGTFSSDNDWKHGYLPRTVGWYRKHFYLPEEWKGSAIWIHFEGIFHFSSVWLNGEYLQSHQAGYTGFAVRLDNATSIRYGDKPNVLAVRADGSFGSGHWYEGAGIYRPVHLVVTSPVHFTLHGVYVSPEVKASSNGPRAQQHFVVPVQAEIESYGAKTDAEISIAISDDSGNVVGSTALHASASSSPTTVKGYISVNGVSLWSIQSPTLYTVSATIVGHDSVNASIGFRSTRWDANHGIYLNGDNFKFRGFSHHNSFVGVGVAMPPRLHLFRVQASRALGSNVWRMSHNPYLNVLYDLLDITGITCWDENRDYGLEYVREMHDMVKAHRQHPSIIIWSFCNEYECQQNQNQTGLAFNQTAKSQDPYRLTTANGDTDGLDVQGHSHSSNNTFVSFHNEYPNVPQVLSECCSCTSQRLPNRNIPDCIPNQNSPGLLPYVTGSLGVWTLFDYFGEPPGEWPAVSSSFGQFDLAGFPKPHAYWYSTNWMDRRPSDDPGRPPRAASEATARLLDLLDQLTFSKVNSTHASTTLNALASGASVELIVDGETVGKQPVPPGSYPDEVASVSFTVVKPVLSAPCTFTKNLSNVQCHGLHVQRHVSTPDACKQECCNDEYCNTWQYATDKGCWTGHVSESTCTPNTDWVGGGRDTPPAPGPSPPFAIDNATLVSYDAKGAVTATHTLLGPTGPPAKIVLSLDVPSPDSGTGKRVVMDGRDIALVRASVVDAQGRLVSNYSNINITFSLTGTGHGRLIGIGNGDVDNHQHPKGHTVLAFGGLARAIVQVSADCVSPNRQIAAQVDADVNKSTTVIPSTSSCPLDSIEIQAAGSGDFTLPLSEKLSIPVSADLANDGVMAVAKQSVTRQDGFNYLPNFVG